jgi:HPt (histidine-containing phosphotransfer) domain-containing protein
MPDPRLQPLDPPDRGLSVTWFQDLIPDLTTRADAFRTSSDGLGDELMRLFAEQMRIIIGALHAAIATGDEEGIRAQGHSLLGMGGTAGAPEISVVGEELSRAAKRGDMDRCGELTTRLDSWQLSWTPPAVEGGGAPVSSAPRLAGRILVVDDERANRRFLE